MTVVKKLYIKFPWRIPSVCDDVLYIGGKRYKYSVIVV